MSDKEKLCKFIKKDLLKKNLSDYKKLVKKPTHICLGCGRASNDKRYLCDPDEI